MLFPEVFKMTDDLLSYINLVFVTIFSYTVLCGFGKLVLKELLGICVNCGAPEKLENALLVQRKSFSYCAPFEL
jgi:hypothetical protein